MSAGFTLMLKTPAAKAGVVQGTKFPCLSSNEVSSLCAALRDVMSLSDCSEPRNFCNSTEHWLSRVTNGH